MRRRTRLVTSAFAALALGLTACSTAADRGEDGGDQGGLQTGAGVTDDTITLGALVDLTAVFAANSQSILEGTRLYWDQRNNDGGVCDRTVELDVQDHQYDAQQAVSLYRQMSSDVLALSPVLGSAVITALLPSFEQDNMTIGMAAWTSEVLPNPRIQITGTTYDIEMINAIDYLMREEGLQSGDTVGHIYFEGDFGENALKGTQYAAEQHDLEVLEHQIVPTDTDLSTQVNELNRAGADAILMSAGNPQTASVASVAAAGGLDVPIIGNGPIFTPQLLDTPAADALEENVLTVTSVAPPSLDAPAVEEFRTAFEEAYPDSQPIQNGSMYGYAAAQIMGAALDRACEDGNLTRQGLLDTLRSMSEYDSGGSVAGTLDYSDPSVPPSRMVYVSEVNPDAAGGLEAVGDPFVSEDAEQYQFGG